MDHVSKRADLDAIRAEVARIESEPGFDFSKAPIGIPIEPAVTGIPATEQNQAIEPAPIPDELPPVVGQFDDAPLRQPFGAWLVAQAGRKGWIADLAKWAKSDPRAASAIDPDDVRKRLTEIYAEGDAFEALDDAELDWAAI